MMFERIARNLFDTLSVNSTIPSVHDFEEEFRKKLSPFIADGTYSQAEFEAELKLAIGQVFNLPRVVHIDSEDEGTEEDLVVLNARLTAFDFELQGWLNRNRLNELRKIKFVHQHLSRTFSLQGEIQNWVVWNAAHILSRCNNPGDWTVNKNGLVYGMVQSGKTASMQALTLLAFAAGYDVVIVLTSVSVALRQQTQNRFDELFDLELAAGEPVSMHVVSPTRETDAPDRNTSSDVFFNSAKVIHGKNGKMAPMRQYLVVKKETRILPKLISQVQGFVTKMDQNGVNPKFLILDDEADYGSLDTGKNEQSKTNARIEELRRVTRNSDYVAYTATPQGCLAADVNSEIGFPRDFIWVLEPSIPMVNGEPQIGTYTGGQELLVDYVDITTRKIPDNDWPFHSKSKESGYKGVVSTKSTTAGDMGLTEAENEFLESVITGLRPVPTSLVNCLLDYAISGAIRWSAVIRDKEDVLGNWDESLEVKLPRHALMIHQSRLRGNQKDGQRLVHIAWNVAKNAIKERNDQFLSQVADFVAKGRRLQVELSIDEAFDYCLAGLIKVTDQRIKEKDISGQLFTTNAFMYLLNSDTEHILEYREGHPLEVKRAAIVLGGDKLSRGLTIEGLAVSYYVRSQKESLADTVMQMARWFGHKAKFMHTMRVYLQDINRALFIELLHEDLRLRYELKKDIRDGVSPVESLFHLQTSKLFSASNRTKTRSLQEALIGDYANGVTDLKWFQPDERIIEHNQQVLIEAVEKWKNSATMEWVHSNRGRLFRHLNPVLVIDFLSKLNYSHPMHPGADAMAAFLKYWISQGQELGVGLNVAVMGGRDEKLTQRKRSGIPKGDLASSDLKTFVLNEFKSLLGGTRSLAQGKYQGDRFIDMPHHDHNNLSTEILRTRRRDVLLLIYLLDPHYIEKRTKFESGDSRYLKTDAGIVALSLIVPESGASNIRAWVNKGVRAEE
ncbi:MAG TPA: hypothetical protein DCX14_03445 [Flavobacteriales bacterium]|nr:hypothetical protein [Flavobacteriales bacterium]